MADTSALQDKLPKLLLLVDRQLAASNAWGVHAAGADHPDPGTFVVARSGGVRWRRLGDARGDWPTYSELAAAL